MSALSRWAIVVATLCFFHEIRVDCLGTAPRRFGCNFSNQLCLEDEECVDDGFLGSCQLKIGTKDMYSDYLDLQTVQSLERYLRTLVAADYSWDDPYVQCIVAGVLLSYRYKGQLFDSNRCGKYKKKKTLKLTSEEWQFLEMLLNCKDYDKQEELYSLNVGKDKNKKLSDLVCVHKYFKPNDDVQSDSESATEDSPYDFLGQYKENYIPRKIQKLRKFSDSSSDILTLQDIKLLKSIFDNEKFDTIEQTKTKPPLFENQPIKKQFSSYNINEWEAVKNTPRHRQFTNYYDNNKDNLDNEDGKWGQVEDNENIPSEELLTKLEEEFGEKNHEADGVQGENAMLESHRLPDENLVNTETKIPTMIPKDAKLLGDLTQGTLNLEDLDSSQLDQLNSYLNRILNDAPSRPGISEKVRQHSTKQTNAERLGINFYKDNKANAKVFVEYPLRKLPVKKTEDKWNQAGQSTHQSALPRMNIIDGNYVYIQLLHSVPNSGMYKIVKLLQEDLHKAKGLHLGTFTDISFGDGNKELSFKVKDNPVMKPSKVAKFADSKEFKDRLKKIDGVEITLAGIGRGENKLPYQVLRNATAPSKYFVLAFVLCGCIAGLLVAVVVIFLVKRHLDTKKKLKQIAENCDEFKASVDYQDLCRQRMQNKASEKPEPLHVASHVTHDVAQNSPARSSRSSTSSWSEEPVSSNMDISTGHAVLSYMEDHLKNKDRLDKEWESLCSYVAEPCLTDAALKDSNVRKNRYTDILPYDHSRVVLSSGSNVSHGDYISASTITDHDPRNPAYVATQGPLPHTVADFWQMVWEQGSVVIVSLCKLTENGSSTCHRFWPSEGSELYHIYEVHLVSEHIWCDDYLVRSFYLKNLQTNETRTVTQFHFLTWPDLGVPASVKSFLDFRRKVNKSYRGKSCPVVVHCSDGVGRTGTYCLIDMVLNRMGKGAKEIDIAATLEHIRDQRMYMVKTKEQFEFVLACVAEEVHMILKSLPQ